MRWEDAQLYQELKARFAAHLSLQGGEYRDTVRDSQEIGAEMVEREKEKSKTLRRDPLGVRGAVFHLRTLETKQVDYLEQALLELQEELRRAGACGKTIEDVSCFLPFQFVCTVIDPDGIRRHNKFRFLLTGESWWHTRVLLRHSPFVC